MFVLSLTLRLNSSVMFGSFSPQIFFCSCVPDYCFGRICDVFHQFSLNCVRRSAVENDKLRVGSCNEWKRARRAKPIAVFIVELCRFVYITNLV